MATLLVHESTGWWLDVATVGRRWVRKVLDDVLDLTKVEAYAKKHAIRTANLEELVRHPEVEGFIWKRVERVNEKLASFEQIKKITLLSQPFSIGGGELTPTLKVRRQVVSHRYADRIEAMYHE